MNCPFCGADEEWPSSPCASFTQYECGSQYRDGDNIQSTECKLKVEIDSLKKRLSRLESRL